MTEATDDAEAEKHRAKMAKRKAVQDAEVAEKTIEKGLLIVHTGTGKGKSTAAFGLTLRMLGRGHRVGVVQFIKGAWHTAERDALAKFGDQLVWHTMGEGFTWETQDRARDVAAAEPVPHLNAERFGAFITKPEERSAAQHAVEFAILHRLGKHVPSFALEIGGKLRIVAIGEQDEAADAGMHPF